MAITSQGASANHTGSLLEDQILLTLKSYGFLEQQHRVVGNNMDMFNSDRVIRNVPYKNVYGGRSRSEFVVVSQRYDFRARIECRWQQNSGSVDEKFPYFLLNAREVEENPVWLVVDGGGAKPEAVRWLKNEAKKTTHKEVGVFTISEFNIHFREFMKRRQAA